MIRKPQNLTAAEMHAAEDLALYTVNTSALYPRAQEIMRFLTRPDRPHALPDLATGRFHPNWVLHAKRGRESYVREMGRDAHSELFFKQHVLHAAAFLIAEHYGEELAEIRESQNG